MSKRSFGLSNWTPTATADAATLGNSTYMAIKGGNGTQLIRISEIFAGGLAGSSAPTALCYAHSSTLASGPTALAAPGTDGPLKGNYTAPGTLPTVFFAATTGGQRSAAVGDPKLHLAFNAFGSLVRWQAPPDGEFEQLGNIVTSPSGECYLSSANIAGAGLIDAHILYEPL